MITNSRKRLAVASDATTFVIIGIVAVLLCFVSAAGTEAAIGQGQKASQTKALPIRGLHLSAPGKRDLATAIEFIRTSLAKEGVNTLILEFDFNFDFQSRSEFANPSVLGGDDVKKISEACREKGIQLIPQLNCLGHQSWAQRNGRLLEKHPEFDETSGKFPENKGVYCRSYCPLHPKVHEVLFDLIDELAKACDAKAFHVGMDEVFILGDSDCPRCKGKSPAELFAGEVKTLHDHLKSIGCKMWMWGDRFIDGKSTRIGKWEASENGTQSAVDLVPKDIVICDWHYEKAHETARYFANKGFDVVSCPWRKSAVALAELSQLQAIRSGDDAELARHALGMVHTTWCGFSQFHRAYTALNSGAAAEKTSAFESAQCFIDLFKATRQPQ